MAKENRMGIGDQRLLVKVVDNKLLEMGYKKGEEVDFDISMKNLSASARRNAETIYYAAAKDILSLILGVPEYAHNSMFARKLKTELEQILILTKREKKLKRK
jgi:hypothetical protein